METPGRPAAADHPACWMASKNRAGRRLAAAYFLRFAPPFFALLFPAFFFAAPPFFAAFLAGAFFLAAAFGPFLAAFFGAAFFAAAFLAAAFLGAALAFLAGFFLGAEGVAGEAGTGIVMPP